MFITHLTLSLAIFYLSAYLHLFQPSIILMIVLGIATLLPDIDHPGSYISNLGSFTKFLSLTLTKDLTHHRGFFHSIYGAILFTVIAGIVFIFFNPFEGFSKLVLILMVFMGYIFHLIGDSLTKSGINWLWKNEKYHFSGPISTGGQLEAVFMYALLFIIGYMFLKVGLV
jgi:membrane-bound metal-dependent hydrolase YbcI (DUF457 family)